MSELGALLFGAVIVVFFSYERFNRGSYEADGRLERLVNLLSPDKMRARRIVLRAYVVYVATLLILYLFFCAYAEVLPMIGGPTLGSGDIGASELPMAAAENPRNATGFAPDSDGIPWSQPLSASATPGADRSIGIAPEVSLAVALIMVGLAPSFPILQRFEAWMRDTTHRLAGIPTHIIGEAEELRRRTLDIEDTPSEASAANALLLPPGDRRRLAHYQETGRDKLTAPADFENDLKVIFAVSAWILDRRMKLEKDRERDQFEPLEGELRRRKENLTLALDERSGFGLGGATETPAQAGTDERQSANWERLAADADKLADDLCLLLALYDEHEIIRFDAVEKTSDPTMTEAVRQQARARQRLRAFIMPEGDEQALSEMPDSNTMPAWLWTVSAVLGVTFVWSLWPGGLEAGLQGGAPSAYGRMLSNGISNFNVYCFPMLVALGLRDGGLHTHRWKYMSGLHWTQMLPQAALLVFVSWAAATIFIIGLVLWRSGLDTVWDWPRLRGIFEYNAPMVLRGAVLALIVICMLDSPFFRQIGRHRHRRRGRSLSWAVFAALVMAAVGGVTRSLTSLAAGANAQPPRVGLDEIDRGLIVYAVLFTALVGFWVVFCIAEAVQAPSRRRGGRRPTGPGFRSGRPGSGGPDPAPAE